MLQTISMFLPELLLAFFASELLLFGAISKKDRKEGICSTYFL